MMSNYTPKLLCFLLFFTSMTCASQPFTANPGSLPTKVQYLSESDGNARKEALAIRGDTMQEEVSCQVPNEKVIALRDAQTAFSRQPSRDTADAFLDHMPPDFCRFDAVYGYDEVTKAGPLYEHHLWGLLGKLEEHVPLDRLMSWYVGYAIEARWNADNVNALQEGYQRLAIKYPAALLKELSRFGPNERATAYRFLFDGPHPSASQADAQRLIENLCDLDQRACGEMKVAWQVLVESEDH